MPLHQKNASIICSPGSVASNNNKNYYFPLNSLIIYLIYVFSVILTSTSKMHILPPPLKNNKFNANKK